MSATYVLRKNLQGKFVFTFKTHDGQVLWTSPCYTDRDIALRSVSAARSLGRREANYELRTAENGQAYFVFKNTRNEVLGQSEMYPDAEGVRKGITLARARTRGARLEDLTLHW